METESTNSVAESTESPARILIAEDSPSQAIVLRRLLVSQGYEVLVAHDGLEAFRLAQNKTPDLIISDISMPIMDGFELCQKIRETPQLANKPVILLTELSDFSDIIKGLNSGADNYLTKPYYPPLLLERVAETLRTSNHEHDKACFEIKMDVQGGPVTIKAGAMQLTNLLLSTYRNAIEQNKLLQMTQNQLANLNTRLEQEIERKSNELIEKEHALTSEVQQDFLEQTKQLEEIRNSLMEAISALAETVELRDPYTAGHQKRVSELAAAIAHEMGFSENEVNGVRLAGAIHDIGKIRVPAEILSKPGKLDDSEMALIRLHSEAGYQILKNIHFPWPVARMVQQHHERMDGSGYPLGLKQEQILPSACIIGVADVIDAMSARRAYRTALGIDKAIEEIKSGRGKYYDTATVDACLKVLEKGLWKPEKPF